MEGNVQSWVRDVENWSCSAPESLDMLDMDWFLGLMVLRSVPGVVGGFGSVSPRGAPFRIGDSRIVISFDVSPAEVGGRSGWVEVGGACESAVAGGKKW